MEMESYSLVFGSSKLLKLCSAKNINRFLLFSTVYLLFLLLKMNNSLPIVDDLAKVFPDIEGELCSRHSILLGKLRNTFNKVYDSINLLTKIWIQPTT